MKHRMAFTVLALLLVSLLGSASALAQEFPPMMMDLEAWFLDFFQVSEDEIEPLANLAYVHQEGNDNSSEQVQQGENLRAFVYQSGDENQVQQWQTGWGHWAGTYQMGNRNSAVIQQVGTDNWAGTYQLGDANTVRIEQSGLSFTALVTQIGHGNSA
ncbi:MAG: hypothetical protein WBK16_04080, partial [Limnochordia bacterium]